MFHMRFLIDDVPSLTDHFAKQQQQPQQRYPSRYFNVSTTVAEETHQDFDPTPPTPPLPPSIVRHQPRDQELTP